jgi:hypothetical protein
MKLIFESNFKNNIIELLFLRTTNYYKNNSAIFLF